MMVCAAKGAFQLGASKIQFSTDTDYWESAGLNQMIDNPAAQAGKFCCSISSRQEVV
jgi:hypothetical protein